VSEALQVLDKLVAAGQFHDVPQQTSLEAGLNSKFSGLTDAGPDTLHRE
jgi:hypothetical protein